MLAVSHYFASGIFLSLNACAEHRFRLHLCGMVRSGVGDAMLFRAFIIAGTRFSSIVNRYDRIEIAVRTILGTVIAVTGVTILIFRSDYSAVN
jgi:hypothetical protein